MCKPSLCVFIVSVCRLWIFFAPSESTAMFGQKAFLAPPTASLRLVRVKILTSKTMLCGFNVKNRVSFNTDGIKT